MRRGYLIFAGTMLALAVVVCWQSATLVIWTPIGPGPGFFTAILGGLLAILAAGVAWEHRKAPAPEPAAAGAAEAAGGETASTGAAPVAAAPRTGIGRLSAVETPARHRGAHVIPFVLKPLGYRITVFALLVYLLAFVERRRILISVPVAAGTSLRSSFSDCRSRCRRRAGV